MLSFFAGLIKPLTYISPIIFAAYFTSSTGRYYVRLGMYIGCLSVVGTASSFIALGMSLVGKMYDVNHIVASSFYYVASRVLDITIEVEGEEHLQTRPAVMIGNHQSMLDIIWLGRCVTIYYFVPLGRGVQLCCVCFYKEAREIASCFLRLPFTFFCHRIYTSSRTDDALVEYSPSRRLSWPRSPYN